MTENQLDTLEEKGLVKVATVRPELEYLFRHALVQDAAYGSLLKQERRELHGQVGEALEQLYPERVGELAPVLAMHFEQAGETAKAIDYYAAGGQHALEQNAIQEAFGAFDQAAALIRGTPGGTLPQGVPVAPSPEEALRRRRQRIEVQLGRAQAGYSFLSADETLPALEALVTEADELGDLELVARVHQLIALGRLQSGSQPSDPIVARSLQRITEVGDALGDPSIRAMPLAFVGLSQVFSGPIREGVIALEEAVPLMQQQRDSIGAAFARGGLAIGYATLGDFEKADAAAENAKQIAKDGDLIAQLDALIAESMVRATEGRLDQAVPLAQECVDRAEETGASACIMVSSWILGDAFHQLGRYAEARDVLRRGADVALAVDRQVWRPTLQAWLRTSSAALGEAQEGDSEEALATARAIGNHMGEAGILGKRAEIATQEGHTDAAIADFAAAAEILGSEGARPLLARVLRSWGETLGAAGRTDDAAVILQKALTLFEELGLAREAAVVKTILSLGGTKLAFD
jgi:tetratricopeptide (TPR) repeat protein